MASSMRVETTFIRISTRFPMPIPCMVYVSNEISVERTNNNLVPIEGNYFLSQDSVLNSPNNESCMDDMD